MPPKSTMNVTAVSSHMIQLCSDYVQQYLRLHLPAWAVYHSLQHTRETVDACIEIGRGTGLSDDDLEILILAAWFHDAGYVVRVEGHEEAGCKMAEKYLTRNNFPVHKVESVLRCIYATKVGCDPLSLLEKIIKDADLISLGRTDYLEKNDLMRSEMEVRNNLKYSEEEWLTRSIKFLSSHQFHTEYARMQLSLQLEENLKNLENQLGQIR